jgi:hypothetical protein
MALCAHVAIALMHGGPVAVPDVSAYLSVAQWVAGSSLPEILAFFPGYGLLLSPIAVMGFDGNNLHTAALVLNAVAASISVLLAAKLAGRLGGGPRIQIIATMIAIVHPSLSVASRIAWPETLLILALLLISVCLTYQVDASYRLAGMVSCVCVLLHPRAIVIMIAILVIAAIQRKLRALILGLLPVAVIGATLLTLTSSWPQSRLAAAQKVEFGSDLVATSLGQVLAVSASTGGLVAIGVALGVMAFCNLVGTKETKPVHMFLALSFLGMALLGGWVLVGSNRIDTLVYGRYADIWCVPLSVSAITWLSKFKLPRSAAIICAGVCVTGMILVVANSGLVSVEPRRIMTLSLAGFWVLASNRIVLVAALAGAVVLLSLCTTQSPKKIRIAIPLALLLSIAISSTLLSHSHLHSVGQIADGQSRTSELVPAEAKCLSHSTNEVPSYAMWLYRLQLPDIEHKRVNLEAGELPCGRYIIAGLDLDVDCVYMRLIGSEPRGTWGLWLYPKGKCF